MEPGTCLNAFHPPGIEQRFLGCTVRSLITIPTEPLQLLLNITENDGKGGTCSTHSTAKFFVWNLRQRRTGKYNIKMDHVGWVLRDWDEIQYRTLLNATVNVRFHKLASSSCVTVAVSLRSCSVLQSVTAAICLSYRMCAASVWTSQTSICLVTQNICRSMSEHTAEIWQGERVSVYLW